MEGRFSNRFDIREHWYNTIENVTSNSSWITVTVFYTVFRNVLLKSSNQCRVSLHSKRFRGVGEQRKPERYFARAKLGWEPLFFNAVILCPWTPRKRLLRRESGKEHTSPTFKYVHFPKLLIFDEIFCLNLQSTVWTIWRRLAAGK